MTTAKEHQNSVFLPDHIKEAIRVAKSVAYRILRNSQDAEDAAGHGLLAAVRYGDRVPADKRQAFVIISARNKALTMKRRQKHTADILAEDAGEFITDNDVENDPEKLATQRESARELHDALKKLPTRQRKVMVLFYMQGAPMPEVAKVLDIPLGTVKSDAHRGRERLRALLSGTR